MLNIFFSQKAAKKGSIERLATWRATTSDIGQIPALDFRGPSIIQ